MLLSVGYLISSLIQVQYVYAGKKCVRLIENPYMSVNPCVINWELLFIRACA